MHEKERALNILILFKSPISFLRKEIKYSKTALQVEDCYRVPKDFESERLTKDFQAKFRANDLKLSKALYATFLGKWGASGLLKFFKDCTTLLITVLFLWKLESIFQSPSSYKIGAWLFGAFLVQILGTFLFNLYMWNVMNVGFCVRTVLSNVIYEKALRLDHAAKQEYSSGKIMNMIASDTMKLEMVIAFLHNVWSGPFVLVVVMVALYQTLGGWPLLGVLCSLSLIGLQYFFMKKIGQTRQKSSSLTDQRLKRTTEIIEGIRAVTSYNVLLTTTTLKIKRSIQLIHIQI